LVQSSIFSDSLIAHILSIGNEILIGDTVNTNATWMAARLTAVGVHVQQVLVIGDSHSQIMDALQASTGVADLLLITGGLGPTRDDITKAALAAMAGCGYRLDEDVLHFVKAMFERRGLTFSPSNREQAMVPEAAETLFNRMGTAPGLWMKFGRCDVAAMPGVPSEMKYLMDHEVMPRVLQRLDGKAAYEVSYMHTYGISESQLADEVVGDTDDLTSDNVLLAYLPGQGGVTLRVSSFAETPVQARHQARPLIDYLLSRAGDHIFSQEPDASLARTVVGMLGGRGMKIATAESCTGGLLAGAITDIAGSSAVFDGGIVAYANRIKEAELSVPPSILDAHGAVSAQTALAMAEAVARKFGADIGVSTTGIAGPDGGTPDKPVGTIWIGYWSDGTQFSTLARLFRDRDGNRMRSVGIALDIVRRQLEGIDRLPFDMQRVFPD
jgi:nicotinamide-nucleotide amidase